VGECHLKVDGHQVAARVINFETIQHFGREIQEDLRRHQDDDQDDSADGDGTSTKRSNLYLVYEFGEEVQRAEAAGPATATSSTAHGSSFSIECLVAFLVNRCYTSELMAWSAPCTSTVIDPKILWSNLRTGTHRASNATRVLECVDWGGL